MTYASPLWNDFKMKIINRSSVCPLILQTLLLFAVALGVFVKLLLDLHAHLVILQRLRLPASFFAIFRL